MTRHPIFDLCDALVEELAALNPPLATYLGIGGYDHLWADLSPQGSKKAEAACVDMERRLGDLAAPSDPWDQLAVHVARDYLEEAIESFANSEHLRDLNSIASPTQTFHEIFDHMPKQTSQDWDAICQRLETIAVAFEGYRQTLAAGLAVGATVPKRQAIAVANQCRTAASNDSVYSPLPGELAASAASQDFAKRLESAIADAKEANESFASWLNDTYAVQTTDRDGVGHDRYVRAARRHLGTSIDPAATYEWGWEEVASLRAQMEDAAAEIAPGGSIGDALHILKTDPDRAAPDRESFVRAIDERLKVALDQLSGVHFDVPEQIRRVDVNLAAPGGPLGAYYVGPSEDFTRAGSVWWSVGNDQGPFPLFDQITTAYHEGFPGHHLQVGMQVCQAENLSRLHRLAVWYPGLGEGWALYSELLMNELGFLDKPDYVFGFLAAQMLRACRVVIDIGSHLEYKIPTDQPFRPGESWTFDTGAEMLVEYATLERPYAESEMTRYLGWPGQAISYKVGEKAILDIRTQLEAREGFDLKAFHDRLLKVGPVGLDLLGKLMLD